MGDKVNKRERGLWSAFTPETTPFKYQVDEGVILPLPSLKALQKFRLEVQDLIEFYNGKQYLCDDEGNPLTLDSAIMLVYERKYRRWLQGNN